jgi:hypothetical protein
MVPDSARTYEAAPENAAAARVIAPGEGAPGELRPAYTRAIWALIIAGSAIRIEQYLHNRSLWLDEAMMALNVLHRSFHALTQKLSYELVAPIGWLWLEKLCRLALGKSELALRLVPLLASIVVLALAPWIAAQVLPRRAQILAVALIAFNPALIYYATELKPYVSDAAIAAVIWSLTLLVLRRGSTVALAGYAIAGAAALWVSYSAIFVLAGVGGTLLLWYGSRRDWREVAKLSAVWAAWLGSFAADYLIALARSSSRPNLLSTYPFLHFPPRHFQDIDELLRTVFGWQQEPWALALVGVMLFAFVVGSWHLVKTRPLMFWIFVSPLLIALLVSALHRYPILGRFMLFAVMGVVTVVAAGVEQVRLATRGQGVPVGSILLFLVLLQPVFMSGEYVVQPVEAEEFKAALNYALAHRQPADVFYVYCYAKPHFDYYAELYGLEGLNVVRGSCFRSGLKNHVFTYNWNFLRDDFSKLQGQKRVWVLFTHDAPADGLDEKNYAIRALNEEGRLLDMHLARGATVFLYDLSQPPVSIRP